LQAHQFCLSDIPSFCYYGIIMKYYLEGSCMQVHYLLLKY
jgi:hypothetical protein